WRHEVADDRVDPGDFVDAKKNARASADGQFINWRLGKKLAVDANALHHGLAQFFANDSLHCAGDKLKIALICDLKFHLVPNVGEKRPGIIIDDSVEHF